MLALDPVASARVDATVPPRAGVGLKAEHTRTILAERPPIGWFEIHPENYMGDGGPPHHVLERIRQDYPLSIHGVGLSIGSAGGIDREHVSRLRALIRRYEPGLFSEHLAWSSHDEVYLGDLLPLPYTDETLRLVAEHIDAVQSGVGRQMLLENPSTYVQHRSSDLSEIDFLKEVVARTGCGLLLDVNNVQVSAVNHAYDPQSYIDAFPIEHVQEMHLAGYASFSDDAGAPLLVDAHDRAVMEDVWTLYRRAIARAGRRPTLIEWDNNIPAWPALMAEAERADAVMSGRRSNHADAR